MDFSEEWKYLPSRALHGTREKSEGSVSGSCCWNTGCRGWGGGWGVWGVPGNMGKLRILVKKAVVPKTKPFLHISFLWVAATRESPTGKSFSRKDKEVESRLNPHSETGCFSMGPKLGHCTLWWWLG